MINQRFQTSEENPPLTKQNRILTAVAQDIVKDEVDDIVADGMDICDIIDNHHSMQPSQYVTSNDLRSLGETIRNTLLEVNEIREQNRERRHRDLLEVLTKISLPNSGPTKCEEINAIVDNGSIDIKEELLNTTKNQSTSNHIAEDNMLQKKSLDNSNKTTESNSSTTVQQQGFDHSKHNQISDSLNFLDEQTTNDHTEASQMHSVSQKKGIKKACSPILGNRKIVTANRNFAVNQNTKEYKKMEEKLIESIKMHPCLFDKSSSVFRNKYLKERAWQAVACSTGVSEDHCKGRWKSLRDRFVREISNKMKSGAAVEDKPEWCYMESMRFLTKHVTTRKTSSNFQWMNTTQTQSCSQTPPMSQNEEEYIDLNNSSEDTSSGRSSKRQHIVNESHERFDRLCGMLEAPFAAKAASFPSRNSNFLKMLDECLQKKSEEVQDLLKIELLTYVYNAN